MPPSSGAKLCEGNVDDAPASRDGPLDVALDLVPVRADSAREEGLARSGRQASRQPRTAGDARGAVEVNQESRGAGRDQGRPEATGEVAGQGQGAGVKAAV
jgi:hypothetical protein